MDQVSFLALRTLGYGTLAQVTWLYNRPVNVEGLRRFHHNLGHGLLGRRIERSPLPFARDRWVVSRGPDDIVGYRAGAENSQDELREMVSRTFDEFGLTAEIM
jgi:hypothetical protein